MFKNLQRMMSVLNDDLQFEIIDEVKKILKTQQSLQLLQCYVEHLQEGDLVLDMKDKELYEVDYVSVYCGRLSEAVLDTPDTIMISYKGIEDADNFDINSKVIILIDKAKLEIRGQI